MIKVDLITGFLGAGKTTFINKYAKYLTKLGEKVCIIENDYGAINVDVMLVDKEFDVHMISGGCDNETHKRRFKTKLISLYMLGYTRIIVEPSGIYDTDEFFDVINDSPIDEMYIVGNIFCIYDINTKNLSFESKYILSSEIKNASKIIVTKRKNNELVNIEYINSILKEFNSNRVITENDIINFEDINFDELIKYGYVLYDNIKYEIMNSNKYDSLYILDKGLSKDTILNIKNLLFNNPDKYGYIFRIKGFIKENDLWNSINIDRFNVEIKKTDNGQDVIIIIGEKINKVEILKLTNV